MTMEAISYTAFRANLAKKMKEICDNHLGLIVTRKDKEAVVVLSLEDFRSMEETLYLLQSPRNAKRLMESIEQANRGEVEEMELFEDYED
jgi:antitoxin YefM